MKSPRKPANRKMSAEASSDVGEYQEADSHSHRVPTDASWFERRENVRKIIIALVVVCVVLVLAEFFYTNHHPHFGIESSFAFQAWFGFVTFVVIVFLGRFLRLIVSRPEDYYDRDR